MPRLPLALFVLVCAAASGLGNLILVAAGALELPVFFVLGGVLVGTLVVTDTRHWKTRIPAAAATMLAGELLFGRPLAQAVVMCLVVSLEGFIAARTIRRVCGEFSLTHLAHIWTLICVAALVPVAGGIVVATVFGPNGGWFETWRGWYLMSAAGIGLNAPLLIAATQLRTTLTTPGSSARTVEFMAVLLVGAVTSAVVFGGLFEPVARVPAYLLPFFLWSVFRFGPGGTAAALFLVGLIGLWNTWEGHGLFALPGDTRQEWVLRSQGALGVAVGSLLLMAGGVAERRRVARENEMLVADLQKALVEIKTLRGFIPLCAWCHKVRDDAGFWRQIENYLDEHTDATVSHSICPSCNERAQLEIASHNTERA